MLTSTIITLSTSVTLVRSPKQCTDCLYVLRIYDSVGVAGADAHVNTCFKHFILFAKHYSLIPEKELAPLADLIHNLIHNHDDDDMEGED